MLANSRARNVRQPWHMRRTVWKGLRGATAGGTCRMAASYENDPDRRHFATMLKTIREARGLSREEFGALCGYSASTIKSVETLQRPADIYHAKQFDEALGLDDMFQHEAKRFGKSGHSAVFGAFTDVEQEADGLYWFDHS